MQSTLFRYKIYRTRLIATIAMVTALSILLFCGMGFFYVRSWINAQQKAAEDSFAEIEARVHLAVEQTNEFMVHIYSNTSLIQDITALFQAQTELDYIQARSQNSRSNRAHIGYFPFYFYSLIRSPSCPITGTILVSENGNKGIHSNTDSGEIQLVFFSQADNIEPENYGDTILKSYKVHTLDNITKKSGEIRFLIRGHELYRTKRANAGACVVYTNGTFVAPTHSDPNSMRRFQYVQNLSETRGSFKESWFNRVYYTTFYSGLYDYNYIATIDTRTLLRQNRFTLLSLLLTFALLNIVLLAWILYGLQDDAKFLGYILRTISAVEKGDFQSAKSFKHTITKRKDEYGIIATALQNMVHVLDEYIRIEYRLKIEQQETAMRALQHQINPHFLYNTLETIRARALVEKDTTTANSIALLGGLFREIVKEDNTIPLHKEVELLKMYLDIMELRYTGKVSYQITIEPSMYELQTVKFWLQPLAENFFRHGFDPSSEYNLLLVQGYEQGNGWCIELLDNGSGIEPTVLKNLNQSLQSKTQQESKSIGLRNVYIRLKHFYGEEFSLHIRNHPDGGACVSVYIPKKENTSCTPC